MLRKTYLVYAVAVLIANPACAGFYIGAGLGPEYAQFTQKAHVFDIHKTFDVIDEGNFSGAGVFGTFLGGYSWIHNRFYLAGEANFNPSSVQYRVVNHEYINQNFLKTTFTIHYSEGVSALPGFLLTKDAVLYGRIAYANGHIAYNNTDPTVRSTVSNRSGVRYGVGLRYNFTPNLTIMADYSQTNYTRFSSYVFEPFGGVLKHARIYPVSAQFAFALLYNFEKSAHLEK